MIGGMFMVFDDEGHLLCCAEAAWLDEWNGVLPYRCLFAPIEDEL